MWTVLYPDCKSAKSALSSPNEELWSTMKRLCPVNDNSHEKDNKDSMNKKLFIQTPSRPQFNLLPSSRLRIVLNQSPRPPLRILIVRKIQPFDLLWTNNHDPEILPGNGIVKIFHLLPKFKRGILGFLRLGLARRRSLE